jgi:pre-mRNA-splicing factor 38A
VRLKIHNDPYFKEKCFALTAESIVDRAIELKYIGGTFGGNRRPSKFLCLILKMLQIQPDEDIVLEFIKNKDYKYIRALGAFYWRLVGKAKDIYTVLEPLYADYRRLVIRRELG